MKKKKNSELNRLSIQEFKSEIKIPVAVILDNVRSLNNVGSVFRTADAFLIETIYLCGITATPPHRDIHKTALGATDSVEWKYYKNTLDIVKELKQKNYKIVAVEQVHEAIPMHQTNIEKNQPYALIFGHEVKGINEEILSLCDFAIEIPQYGTKHSLNISVCAGIVLWGFFKHLGQC